MSTEDNKIVKPDESQKDSSLIDKSRRSFAKAGMVAPVIMTLTSKTALGNSYYCTISGMQSGNMSSHTGGYTCGVGISPGGWWQNATKTKNPDGNLNQWGATKCNPYTIKTVNSGSSKGNYVSYQGTWYKADSTSLSGSSSWSTIFNTIKQQVGNNAKATTFNSIFGGNDTRSLWDVLDQDQGSLEWHAIADYLNAELNQATGKFSPVYDDITPAYIVAVYNDSSLSDADKQAYFELIHH